jgi:hypothetical protein
MSQLSKKSVQMIGRIALAAPLLLGAVAISLANQGGPARQSLAPSTSPAPSEGEATSTSAPKVTVNGEEIPVDKKGTNHTSLHKSDSTVTISNGHSTVTKESSQTSSSPAAGNNDNVQVNVDSNSTGGNNWGTTQSYGYNVTSNGNSTSFSSTNVFSTGSNHMNVTSP